MFASSLVALDSLEATILIDNDLDPMSPIPPDTVEVTGLMRTLATSSPHEIHDRGDAHKELQMEDICCSAHGLSILVVRPILLSPLGRYNETKAKKKPDRNKRQQTAHDPLRRRT